MLIPVGAGRPPVAVRDVREYVDDEFWSAYQAYYITEMLHALPFAGGWAEQPIEILSAILAIKSEDALLRAEEMEKMRNGDS